MKCIIIVVSILILLIFVIITVVLVKNLNRVESLKSDNKSERNTTTNHGKMFCHEICDGNHKGMFNPQHCKKGLMKNDCKCEDVCKSRELEEICKEITPKTLCEKYVALKLDANSLALSNDVDNQLIKIQWKVLHPPEGNILQYHVVIGNQFNKCIGAWILKCSDCLNKEESIRTGSKIISHCTDKLIDTKEYLASSSALQINYNYKYTANYSIIVQAINHRRHGHDITRYFPVTANQILLDKETFALSEDIYNQLIKIQWEVPPQTKEKILQYHVVIGDQSNKCIGAWILKCSDCLNKEESSRTGTKFISRCIDMQIVTTEYLVSSTSLLVNYHYKHAANYSITVQAINQWKYGNSITRYLSVTANQKYQNLIDGSWIPYVIIFGVIGFIISIVNCWTIQRKRLIYNFRKWYSKSKMSQPEDEKLKIDSDHITISHINT